jgi:hypothetical protein
MTNNDFQDFLNYTLIFEKAEDEQGEEYATEQSQEDGNSI